MKGAAERSPPLIVNYQPSTTGSSSSKRSSSRVAEFGELRAEAGGGGHQRVARVALGMARVRFS
jgi:hypothetical protein